MLLAVCFLCVHDALGLQFTKTEMIGWSHHMSLSIHLIFFFLLFIMEKIRWRHETFFMPIFWITYAVSVELTSSSIHATYSMCSKILPASSSPPFSAPPRVSQSFLYLPSPAFFIPPSVPLPLHHCCLHQQQRQQQQSHRGHLSDSICAICKSSSRATGIISLCVLKVKGWPVYVFICLKQSLGCVTGWEDVCVCVGSSGWYHSQSISSWFCLEPGLRTGK